MNTRIIALFVGLMACLPMTSAWASTYYANLTVKISSSSPTGAGTVYAGDTAGSDNAVGSATSSGSATVTIKANAKWDDANFEFLGWSDTDGGAIVSTANPYGVSITSSNTTSPGQGKEVFANFKSRSVPGYTLNFLPATNGGYTQNGQAPAGETEEMTKPYSATLAAVPDAGYRVLGWYKIENGVKTYFKYAAATVDQTFASQLDIGVDFIAECNYAIAKTDSVAGFSTLAEAFAVAASGETVLAFADIEIAEGDALAVPAGVTLNLTEGVKLAAYGKLDIKGQVVGDGKIVKCCRSIVLSAEVRGPYPFCTAVAHHASYPAKPVRYRVSTATTPAETVSGTPGCGIEWSVKIVTGDGTVLRSAPRATKPVSVLCTVNKDVAFNDITGIVSAQDKLADTLMAGGGDLGYVSVQIQAATMNCSDFPENSGWRSTSSSKPQEKIGKKPILVDCAGCDCTIKFEMNNNSGNSWAVYMNGGTVTHSGNINNSIAKFLNCKTVKPTLNANSASNRSRVEIYDCGTVTYSPSGSDMVANNGGVYFLSGGDYTIGFGKNIRAYGGTFTHDPSDYLASPDLYVVELEAGKRWQVTDEKPAAKAFEADGRAYATLADAIANAANGARIVMKDNYDLTGDIVIPAGKTVEIDLSGLKLTGSGKVTNNGTFIVGDGSNYQTGKGTFEPAIVNNGSLSICHGNYTGAITLNAGSSIVTRAGTFTGDIAVNEGAALDFRGGKFAASMAAYLADGYRERLSGGLYCVGEIFEADVKDATLSGSERAYRLSAINFADAADYQLGDDRGGADYADDADGALWYRHAELKSAIDVYERWVVDCTVCFDHAVAADSVNFTYVMSKTLDKDLAAGEVYRCMSPIIESYGYYQISYGRFVKGDPATTVTVGLNNVDGHDENLGTVCTIEMRIYESSKNDDVYLTLARRRVTLGAYGNKAMIRGADGAVTFYPTLADAVAAVGKGGVIELAADCDENVTVNRRCTIKSNGFAFGGTVAAREGWGTVTENEGVYSVEIEDGAASVDEIEFKTVAEALAACAEGAEIVLLRDCAEELKDVAKVCSFSMNGFAFVGNGGIAVEVGYKIAYDEAKATWFVTLAEVQVTPPKAEEIKPEVTEETDVRDESGNKVEVTPEVREEVEQAVEKAAEETVAEVKAALTTTEVIDLKETGIEAAVKESKAQVKGAVIEALKEAVVEKAKTDAKVEEKAEEVQKALDNQEIEVSGFVNVKLTETEMKITKTEEETVAQVVSMRFDVTPKVQIKVNDVAVEAVVPPEEIKEKIRFRLPLTVAFSVSAKVVHHAAAGDEDMGLYPVRNEDGVQFVEVESDSFSPYDVIQMGTKIMVGDRGFDDLAAAIAAAGGDLSKIVIYDGTIEPPADYKLVANEDGTWSFVEKRYVAQIGDKKFESLDEAVENVSKGATIVILDGIALSDVAACVQKLRREGDTRLDTVTIKVADGHADYPKAFFEVDGAESISRNITDVSYTFYAFNPKADGSALQKSDWDIYYGNVENPTPAEIARRDEIAAQIEPFKNFGWHADFEVSFDRPVAEGSVSLSGYYASWLDGTVLTYDLDRDLAANQHYRLLKDKAGILYSYREIIDTVRQFGCGVKNKSADNAGVKMTVELRLYYGTSGHVEGDEVPSILMGTYEYVLKGPEIVMAISDEVQAELTAAGLDAETKTRYEEKIVANEAVNSFKQTGIEANISAEDREAGASGYFAAELTEVKPDDAGVLTEMTFDVGAHKVKAGVETPLEITQPAMLRLPVDSATALTTVKVYCDDGLLGYYPVQGVTISTQQPLDDPTKKPEGKEDVPWQDLSPVTETMYTFVEFPASAFPATYRYKLVDPTTPYDIVYMDGDERLEGLEPVLYRESGNDIPLPRYSGPAPDEYSTFGGWKLGESVVGAIPAGTSGDLTLTVKWEELAQETFEVKVAESVEQKDDPQMTDILLTKAWVDDPNNVNQEEYIAAKTEEEKVAIVQKALNTEAENGNLKWQNYVLGLPDNNPSAQVEAGAEQSPSGEVVQVESKLVVPPVDTGYKVVYALDKVEKDAATGEEIGARSKTKQVLIPVDQVLQGDAKVGYAKLKAVLVPESGGGDESVVPAENTIGIMKVESDLEKTIIPVPWGELGGGEIRVSNLIQVSNLTPGDRLYVYDIEEGKPYDASKFRSWELTAAFRWAKIGTAALDENGQQTDDAGKESDDVVVYRGQGVWLERQDVTKPIILSGQYNKTEGDETTEVEKGTESAPVHNILATPLAEEIDLDVAVGDAGKDTIFVPTRGAPRVYSVDKDGKWGYSEDVVLGNGKKIPVRKVGGKLPPSSGFWYVSRGGKDGKGGEIKWAAKSAD